MEIVVSTGSRRLYRLVGVVLVAVVVSHAAPLGGGFPLLPAEVSHYGITLEIDFAGGTFRGTQTIDYLNMTGSQLEEVFFRLYPNAAAIYGNGFLKVDAVEVDGKPVETRTFVDKTALWIPLASPLEPGERISLKMGFNGQTATWEEDSRTSAGYGIYATSSRSMVLASFHPILAVYDDEGWNIDPIAEIGDAVFSEVASYTVSVTTDSGLSVLTSGRGVDQWDEDGRRNYRFGGQGIRDFVIVIGDGHLERSEMVDGVLLRTNFLPQHSRAGEIAMVRAKMAIDLYQRRFGPFVLHELDLVEVPLVRAAGVEYPGLLLIAEDYCERPADTFFDIIVAHEVAHQWWYAVVGSDVIEEPWLDEALATYCSLLFLEEAYGTVVVQATMGEWQTSYQSARARYPGLSVASSLHDFPNSASYSSFVYSGGAVFLDEVRQRIGDAVFFDALAGYYSDHAFQIAHSADLLTHFEQACGCTLSDIISQYLEP